MPAEGTGQSAQTSLQSLAIPDIVRDFLNGALLAFWTEIGPGGRDLLRDLQDVLGSTDPTETREVFRRFIEELVREIQRARQDPDLLIFGAMPRAPRMSCSPRAL